MVSMGFTRRFGDMPFERRLDVLTCMRGAATLASCFVFPIYLRSLAAHFQSIEQIGSLVSLPDIVRAYFVDKDVVEGTSLTLIHSVRFAKSSFGGMGVKLAPLFLDLLQVIESTGRMLATWVEESKLSKAYDLHNRASRGEEVPGSYTNETFLLTRKIEIAMYIAGIGALIVPFLTFSSAYGAQIAVISEVSYAALCLLHYFYTAHAQGYSMAPSARSNDDGNNGGGESPSCGGKGDAKGSAGGGKCGPTKSSSVANLEMTESIAPGSDLEGRGQTDTRSSTNNMGESVVVVERREAEEIPESTSENSVDESGDMAERQVEPSGKRVATSC